MAGTINVWFIWPHNALGEVIDFFEGKGEDPSHVAVESEDGAFVLEAIAQGVVETPIDYYLDKEVWIVPVEVPYPELAYAAGELMEGDGYSVLGCAQAFIKENTGVSLPLGSGGTEFCAEVAVRMLRAGRLRLQPGRPAKEIMPKHLLAILDPDRKKGYKPSQAKGA